MRPDMKTTVEALVVLVYRNGWLEDADDPAAEMLRRALDAYGEPTPEELAARERARHAEEMETRIAGWLIRN